MDSKTPHRVSHFPQCQLPKELRQELKYLDDFQKLVQLQDQIGLDISSGLDRSRPKSGKSLMSKFGKDTKMSEAMSPKSVIGANKKIPSLKESIVGDSLKVKSGKETTRNQIMTRIACKEELVNIVSESGDKLYFPKVQILQDDTIQ